MAAEIDGLLHVAGVDDRHVEIDECGAAGRRQRAALRVRVIADQGDRSALVRCAGEHRVAQRIARTVEPGRLAVPDADDAFVAARVEGDRQLAAHHGRGRELLVHSRLEDHVEPVGHGQLRRCRDVAVVVRQRAAGVAADVRSSAHARAPIRSQLLVGKAGERLGTTEEGATVIEAIPVGQLVRVDHGHLAMLPPLRLPRDRFGGAVATCLAARGTSRGPRGGPWNRSR